MWAYNVGYELLRTRSLLSWMPFSKVQPQLKAIRESSRFKMDSSDIAESRSRMGLYMSFCADLARLMVLITPSLDHS